MPYFILISGQLSTYIWLGLGNTSHLQDLNFSCYPLNKSRASTAFAVVIELAELVVSVIIFLLVVELDILQTQNRKMIPVLYNLNNIYALIMLQLMLHWACPISLPRALFTKEEVCVGNEAYSCSVWKIILITCVSTHTCTGAKQPCAQPVHIPRVRWLEVTVRNYVMTTRTAPFSKLGKLSLKLGEVFIAKQSSEQLCPF